MEKFRFWFHQVFLTILLWTFLPRVDTQNRLSTYVIGHGNDVISDLSPVYQPRGVKIPAPAKRSPSDGRHIEPRIRYNRRAESPGRITETVYGFLDFTTTVGSTVMIFTPQSEGAPKVAKVSATPIIVMTATATSARRPPKATTVQKILTTTTTPEAIVVPILTTPQPTTNAPSGLAKLLRDAFSSKNRKPFSSKSKRKPFRKHSSKDKNRILTPGQRHKKYKSGPTVTPILIEGKGEFLLTKTPILQPSIYAPEEIVVSASQNLPPLSLAGPFSTNIYNDIENKHKSKPTPSIPNKAYVVNKKSSIIKPTRLVKKTDTIISDGQTIIHKTSVIGTYVNGKYAQLTKSTSDVLNINTDENLISPTTNIYNTVKEVIEGSATQFFKPEPTASLPIEYLFSSSRSPRYENQDEQDLISPSESKLMKRRGSPQSRDDYYNYYDTKDPIYEDDYDDLARVGSEPRLSYRPVNPPRTFFSSTPTYRKAEPSTFRPRFKPSGTRNIPPSFLRNTNEKRPQTRVRPTLTNRPKPRINKRPTYKPKTKKNILPPYKNPKINTEETLHITKTKPIGVTDEVHELIVLRSIHAFAVGGGKNTRYVTYTKTITHKIEPTSAPDISETKPTKEYEKPPLFENILKKKNSEIATLPPINIGGNDLAKFLKTTTETFQTTETMYKTSVLPVRENEKLHYHTLIQTYLITRIVLAVKTVPPVDAFEFIPSDSLNEFNAKLLAEGTENEASLLPGEREYAENKANRVPPPPGFNLNDANLADLAGGKFNPEALDKQMNPKLAAALKFHKTESSAPQLTGTKEPQANSATVATPALSPEALQMAYLQFMNPYMFGALSGANKPQVTSSPVFITTDVTITSSRVLRVILNARPIYTTISSTAVVRTTITSYTTSTIAPAPGFNGMPFGFPGGLPFAAGR